MSTVVLAPGNEPHEPASNEQLALATGMHGLRMGCKETLHDLLELNDTNKKHIKVKNEGIRRWTPCKALQ